MEHLMGYKGVSYIGIEITRNGKLLDKEDDIKDGDKFQLENWNDTEYTVEDNKSLGRANDIICPLGFAEDARKCWVAKGFIFCPYIPEWKSKILTSYADSLKEENK